MQEQMGSISRGMEILVENKKETLKIFFLSAAAEMKNTFGGLLLKTKERIPELGIYQWNSHRLKSKEKKKAGQTIMDCGVTIKGIT